jgi:thiamine pyrophosphate-dependent acetolactate synthase large subunit-like protein
MDWSEISAVVGIAVAITSALGSLLLKAFLNPVNTQAAVSEGIMKDHEERLRKLENQNAVHSIHLENLMKAVDRLVSKIDELVTYEKTKAKEE